MARITFLDADGDLRYEWKGTPSGCAFIVYRNTEAYSELVRFITTTNTCPVESARYGSVNISPESFATDSANKYDMWVMLGYNEIQRQFATPEELTLFLQLL